MIWLDLVIVGVLLRGLNGKYFSRVFNLMVVAAILQMFSGFDNVFTRLTDYYFQFLILYLPMLFSPEQDVRLPGPVQVRRIALSRGQKAAALACVVALSCLYYYSVNLGQTITYEPDNYLNYRFCWEVRDS